MARCVCMAYLGKRWHQDALRRKKPRQCDVPGNVLLGNIGSWHSVPDQTNRKRGFTEHESVDKMLRRSPSSYFLCGSDRPPPATPSYEVVSVICHLKTTGNNKLPLQSHCLDKTIDVEHSGHVDMDEHAHESTQDNNVFLDSFFESKPDMTDNSPSGIPSVVAEDDEKSNSSCKTGQFQSTDTQTVAHSSDTDDKDQCVHSAYTSCKHLSPETVCGKSANSCVSDVDRIQSFNPFESEEHVHVQGIPPDTFIDKKSHDTTENNSENRAFSHHATESCKRQASLYLDSSNTTDTSDAMCEKRSSFKVCRKSGQYYASTSGMMTVEKIVLGEESQKDSHSGCFSKWRKDCVNAYQGHLRFHYLPGSNDSDSDETCPGPNVDVKDSSEVLEKIDMAEILLSATDPLKSGSHNHSETRRFRCSVPECEKAFSQRGSLNRHIRSHLGIRPYSCPLCTMTFSRQYRVSEHMRIHQRSCDAPP